jgi:hypothetical protein
MDGRAISVPLYLMESLQECDMFLICFGLHGKFRETEMGIIFGGYPPCWMMQPPWIQIHVPRRAANVIGGCVVADSEIHNGIVYIVATDKPEERFWFAFFFPRKVC